MKKLVEIIEKPITGEWGEEDLTGEGIQVLRTANFTNEGVINYKNVVTRKVDISKVKHKLLKNGDIIIEKSGGSPSQPVGRAVFFEGKENSVLFNNFTSVLRVRKPYECSNKYLFYFLLKGYRDGVTTRFQNKTTGIANLKLERFINELEIPLPPLDIQKKIAATLDSAMELINLRKKRPEELDNLIKSTFYDMFGDPVMNANEWEQKTLREVSQRISDGPFGSNLKSEHYSDSGVRVIRLQNIGVSEFLNSNKAFISVAHYETLKKYTCLPGDLLIGTLGEPNLRACILPEHVEKAINKADCVHFVPDGGKVNAHFVCGYLNQPATLVLAEGSIHGQTRTRISMSQVATLPIFIPPLELQNRFADFVLAVEAQKSEVKKSIEESQLLFDSLMSEYFE